LSSVAYRLGSDGFLANRLMHPRFGVEKEYVALVTPPPKESDLACLRKGIELEEGIAVYTKVSVLSREKGKALVRLSTKTGYKRQIRRTFDILGIKVISLTRIRIGSLTLGKLKPGEWRKLSQWEVKALYMDTGL